MEERILIPMIPVRQRALAPYELLNLKKRERCPFYGFSITMGILVDSQGNRCALIVDRYSPCKMEYSEKKPDWNSCQFNNPSRAKVLEKVCDLMKVFPEESKISEGIPFKHWKDYVMS